MSTETTSTASFVIGIKPDGKIGLIRKKPKIKKPRRNK
jgi:hypothetical protein